MSSTEDLARAIEIVEDSRQSHAKWLEWQEKTPNWYQYAITPKDSVGTPEHHRKLIEDYDHVLKVLRANDLSQ